MKKSNEQSEGGRKRDGRDSRKRPEGEIAVSG